MFYIVNRSCTSEGLGEWALQHNKSANNHNNPPIILYLTQ